MKKIFICALLGAALAGCDNSGKFHVEGAITNAKDSVLYLENITLDGDLVKLDSTKLSESGTFSLAGPAGTAPEFYRLRIADQIVNIAIDSSETITVNAEYPNMAANYKIEGNEDCKKIQELTLMQMNLIQEMQRVAKDETMNVDNTNDSIMRMIDRYKQKVRTEYIYKNPAAASSYFALFQTVGNQLIFNPRSDKEDIRAFAAVATSWDTFHKGSLRGENLHNIAIEGMKNTRFQEGKNQVQVDPSIVNTADIIDIQLTDNKGQLRKLTDLKGKVVMLDFHLFSGEGSMERIMQLRDIYNKYHDRGFEVYQIGLDADEHFWKVKTSELPWICVHDGDGMNSKWLATYNVQYVPAYFIIKKDNSLYKRDAQIKDLEEELKALL